MHRFLYIYVYSYKTSMSCRGRMHMLCSPLVPVSGSESSSSEEDASLIAWKDNAHRRGTEVDRYQLRYPSRGLPDLGTRAQRYPPGSETRPTFLKKDMMVAVNMKGERHPLSIGKIISLFVDEEHGAPFARVHWYEPLQNKFRGTYRPNPAGLSHSGNLLLERRPGVGEVTLVHWSKGLHDHSVLTQDSKIRNVTLKLARLDVRLQNKDIQQKLNAR